MKRLTRPCPNTENGKYCPYVFGNYVGIYSDDQLAEVVEKLAVYENLEEQGMIKILPVAEGNTVYVVDYTFNCKHEYKCPLYFSDKYKCEEDIRCEHEYKEYRVRESKFNYHMIDKIGKTVFLIKEEAEIKLKEIEGNK